MALRLSKAIGRSPESWLAMQDAHDLWRARQRVDLHRVGKLEIAAA
jgi:plasmid maintenance system antidote protein VapI